MTEQERAELKAELMQEIRQEMNISMINGDASRCLQPVVNKWCNGVNGHGYRGGALIESMPACKGWNSWEHIRRLTCNIMNVSYVRDIKDIERARKIADKLCEVVVELTKERGGMNRLIDADALSENLDKRRTYEIMNGRNKAYGKGVRDAMNDVDSAPTIDAIPVEWLREKMQKPLITSANPFDYVLEAWEQDNSHSPNCGPDYCDID
jgi:hypothetical protein